MLLLTSLGKIILLISLVLTILSTYAWLKYTKKKYPNMFYSFYANDFGPRFGRPAIKAIGEIIKNTHPEDKKYSLYVWAARADLVLLFVSFFV